MVGRIAGAPRHPRFMLWSTVRLRGKAMFGIPNRESCGQTVRVGRSEVMARSLHLLASKVLFWRKKIHFKYNAIQIQVFKLLFFTWKMYLEGKKTMTSNGTQFTVAREMFTTVACDQRWPDVVAEISVHFSKCAFVLFCHITNHLTLSLPRVT